jgi:dTDP-4-dehydrorhamnose 3,5-epimerase
LAFRTTEIAGVWLFEPQVFRDQRGEFFETFRPDQILDQTGFNFKAAQVNTSVSNRGVIRGIHFKQNPPGQAKFVAVNAGSIIDVAIDLRKSSPTFGSWQAFELSADNHISLMLGYGIGHAFLALEDNTRVTYVCDSVFQPEFEHSINPLDAGINWQSLGSPSGITNFIISDKDKTAPSLAAAGPILFA